MMDLLAELRSTTPFDRLEHVVSCSSTQALSQADREPGWAVFWADHQTAGRGRQGKTWEDSPAQDLTLTFRLTDLPKLRSPRLAAAIPVAVARALAALGPEVTIKWPNDLLLFGRKICGILIDTQGRSPDTYHVGVGINVNRVRFPEELAEHSTSVALATGRQADRPSLVLGLARCIADVAARLEADRDLADITAEFCDRQGLVGGQVRATTSDRVIEGSLDRMDLDCAWVGGTAIPLAHLRGLRRL